MMILAAKEGIVVLFDWATERRKKWYQEGRQEGRAQRDQEWLDWYARLQQAQERGEEFTEPPPSAKG